MTRRFWCLIAVALLPCCVALFPALKSQTARTSTEPLLPGPEPKDAPRLWKELVGIYGGKKEQDTIILERDQRLYWRSASEEFSVQVRGTDGFEVNGKKSFRFRAEHNRDGSVAALQTSAGRLTRVDAGVDPNHFFHIQLSKPIEHLRAEALAATPPEEAGSFRKADLVELVSLDPGFHLDIRYAQKRNFLSAPVYTQARAYLQRPAAEALVRILHEVEPLGYGILIHDGYRPWYVTKLFWDATPTQDHNFVADPGKGSRHNRGCAVDLTLYDLTTGKPVEMPGLYDEMSPRSFPDFPGGTSLQRWRRELLRRAMESEGFTVNVDEWWHFDYKDWKLYPILNIRFEQVAAAGDSRRN